MDNKVFAFLGPPCSGKSTQSRIFAETINAQRIESGARLDMIARGEISPHLQELAQIIRTRPWELTQEEKNILTYAQLGDVKKLEGNHIVLDGFGRNASQYKILCDIFGKDRLYFLLFHITARTMYARAEGRFIDPQTRQSFTGMTQEDALQRGLIRRDGDNSKELQRRLHSFRNNTLEVLDAHKRDTSKVYEVNAGHPKVEDVTKDMMSKIRHLL